MEIIEILISLFVGVASDVLAAWIWKSVTNPPIQEKLRSRSALIIGICAGIVAFILLFMSFPPNRIADVTWCQDSDVRISGRLNRKYTGSPINRETLQIQVFKAGGNVPIEYGVFATTGTDGFFSIELPQTSTRWSEVNQQFLINVGYWYDGIFGEQWYGKDFKKGAPPKCSP